MLTHHVDDNEYNKNRGLNKLLKLSYAYSGNKRLTRQCFILMNDRKINRNRLSDMVNMNEAEIVSTNNHMLVYGSRDLNPISWADAKAKKRNIYLITLINSKNTFFRVINDENDYAMIEYSITSKEITFIIDHNNNINKPFIFEFIDVDNDSITRYEFTVESKEVHTSMVKTYGGTVDVDITNKSFNKFKPPKITQYVIADKGCPTSEYMTKEHQLFEIDKYDTDKAEVIIDYIKHRGVKAITWVGNINDETKHVRELIKRNFRVYYENSDEGIVKVKVT